MRVEIWSDVVCPWCYIGKRRFETALAAFPHRADVEVVWRAFELDPEAPQERLGKYAVMLADKYGFPVEQGQEMIDTMTAAAAQDGLDFHFETARVGNTFDAHRLLHLAHERDLQDALKERLLQATFCEGEPIGDHATLVRLAAEAGLDADDASAVLASDRYAEQVHSDEQQARDYGISEVPFFVVDGKLGVSGAQPADVLRSSLNRRGSRAGPLRCSTLMVSATRPLRRAATGTAAGSDPPAAPSLVRPTAGQAEPMPGHKPALPTTQVVRGARLLSLPAGAAALAAEGAVRRLAGQDREQVSSQLRERNAARTRRVLGELKGGALKAGQLLSTVEALFPPDPESTWREALSGLQESNAPLPFADVEPVLRAELGAGWEELFASFEREAVAAASIGQVHRACWEDGRRVAVKVQYPGVREALTADVRMLSLMSRGAALVARGLALPPLVAELRDRLTEELDYEHESRTQTRFATAYDQDPEVLVPSVVRATPRVLVMDWLDGTPLSVVARTGTQQERNHAGGLYQRFLVSGPERAGLLHTDPHPGNFRLLSDGRLGVLDFGSSLELPQMPATFGRLLRALLDDDPDEVLRRLRVDGFVRPGVHVDVAKLLDYMSPFSVPARHESFTFSRDWLRGEFARVNDPRNPEFGVALKLDLPAEHLFTHRVWLGMVGVLCQLEATVPVRSVLQRWLPGFA